MASKTVIRIQVEVYFLNGKGRSWMLNPKTDKLIESKPKHLIIEHAGNRITISREFVAYYAVVKKQIALDDENTLERLANQGDVELDLI